MEANRREVGLIQCLLRVLEATVQRPSIRLRLVSYLMIDLRAPSGNAEIIVGRCGFCARGVSRKLF